MKKQLLLFILMLLPLVVSAFTGETVIDDIKYYINTDDKTAEVRANSYSGDVVIPETVEYEGVTCDVTSIGKYAFTGYSNLTSVTIGNSVTSIGNEAFKDCTSLTSVTIGNSVATIGNYAFSGCRSLTSINVPNSIATIGNYAFDGCRITSIYISDLAAWCAISFTKQTFQNFHLYLNGEEVVDLVIPNSVTRIGDYAFSGCTSLSSVTIPNSVTSIGNLAFSGCTSLSSVTIPNSVTSIGESAFSYCSGLTNIDIPNSVTNIGDGAFSGCSGLTTLTIPSSVTSIGGRAFGDCTSLTSITIPNSVTTIGWSAFENCTSLTSVTIPNSVTEISYSMFKGCYRLSSITIPNTVTSIGSEAFWDCNSLTSITIPSSVTSIGGYAFAIEDPISVYISDLTAWCTMQLGVWPFYGYHLYLNGQEVKELVIPNSMTRIGGYAFLGCHSLTSVTIPNSVTSIGEHAFFGCTSLTSITIGSNVERIDGAFCYNCSNIEDVYCYAETVPSTDSWSFFSSSIFDSATLHVPDGSFLNYASTSPWNQFATIVELGGGSPETFEGEIVIDGIKYYINSTDKTAEVRANSYSGEVFIPETIECAGVTFDVTSIGESAFLGCSKFLTSVTIPNSVTSIGDNAFYGCRCLTSVTIPNRVTIIGSNVFRGCSGLTSIDIPNSVTSIGESAFSNCSNLTSVTIPNSVTSIGVSAFESCSSLTSVDIPNSVTSIENTVFYECRNLTSVSIPASVTSIGEYAFSGCSSLPSVTIPASVTSIGGNAFYGCSSLTSIDIPNSVTSIGESAFSYCSSLTNVDIPNSMTSIENTVFYECRNLTSVSIPASVTSIDEYAFAYCENIEDVYCLAEAVPSIDESVFENSNIENATLHVPDGSISDYSNTHPWSQFATIVGLGGTGTFEGEIVIDGINYYINSTDKTAEVIANSYSGEVFIPETVECAGMSFDVTSIGSAAFQGCSGLTSVTIPYSVTDIGSSAFEGCSALTNVKVDWETPVSISSTTFTNRSNITLYVPAGSKAAYQASDYWREFNGMVEFIEGDVNSDSESDVLDVVDIARYVVGTAAETFVPILADINSDGEVNIADAVCLVNDIAGDQNFAKPMRAPRKPETASDALMLTKGSNGLSLLLENQRDYTAFQFDLYVPEGVDVMKMMLNAQRKQKHQLLNNEVEEGHWRVAALSTSNRTFADNSGELLSFTLAGNANGDIVVSDIHFFTPNGNDYAFYDIQMKVGVATDIQSAGNPLQTTDHPNVYDLSGRKIENSKWSNRQLPKGIYIVNGKKVVIK